MMKMKKILLNAAFILAATLLGGCDDFFNPDTDVTLDNEDYISEESEMYSGYIGIMTKMQAIGDKVIYLNELRGEMVVPTATAPTELYNLYNYDDDLSGNTYADPAKYYDVIIACNDYLQKAKEYRDTHVTTVDDDDYRGLISSTVRLKTWTYLMLAKIYGQAIWFDDPMQSMKDIVSQTPKNLSELVDECDKLLNTGFDGINGTYNMSWNEWLDPANGATSTNDEYKRWNMMVPGYFVLQAEIALWKGDYQKAATTILGEMSRTFALAEYQGNVANIKYMRSGSYGSNYGQQYDSEMPVLTAAESVIMYDYKYNQQNSLLNHFDRSGSYMMRASVPGSKRFEDITFNPSADATAIKTSDARFRAIQEIEKDVEYAIRKYRGFRKSGHSVAHDDTYIMIYHTSDLYFMAIEALNNMGRFEPVSVLMNTGVDPFYGAGVVLGEQWQGLNCNWGLWTTLYAGFRRTYADNGVRGILGLGKRDMWQTPEDIKEEIVAEQKLDGLSDEDKIKKHNDIELVKEAFLEFPCEGKTYPLMIRVAKRWNDYSFIADFVGQKYESDQAKQAEVKAKIMNGAYFVPWDLQGKSSSH